MHPYTDSWAVIVVLPDFNLARPTSLDEALRYTAAGGIPYVGGTELVAAMQLGLLAPDLLVDLKSVPELHGITARSDGLVLGAATRHDDIARHPDVTTGWPILAEACGQVGNERVRATGTIGGNLCFADPRSDVTTVLFALRALVRLRTPSGHRTIPVDEFVTGAMDTDLQDGELLESVLLPANDDFQVYLRHQPAEYPTVCVAVLKQKHLDGAPLRFTVGAVGERPHSYEATQDDLRLDAALAAIDVIDDLNGSEAYKRHLIGVFVRRAAALMKECVDV